MASKRSGDTRERLLFAAADVFAEKGYVLATVAEICAGAGANISAVNYYFGGKEALYQQSWRHSFEASIARHPLDDGASTEASPQERLAGLLTALLVRIADPGNRDFRISQMELVNPTGLLDQVMSSEIRPMREQTLGLVRELLGPSVSERQVVLCESCILSICLHPMLMQRARKHSRQQGGEIIFEDMAGFAGDLVRFALAGIAAFADNENRQE
jgi:TetR/AcrR family transcriptional regulator, regulator of cefoperazone and chloramphenicol sensitivity